MIPRLRASAAAYEGILRQRWSVEVAGSFTRSDVYHDGTFVGYLWRDVEASRLDPELDHSLKAETSGRR